MTKLTPIEDRIIVEALEDSETTSSGLIIPDTASKEKPQKGKVIATGPGKILENGQRGEMEVKNGDVIVFAKYGPSEIKLDGKEYLILHQSDVLAVIEK